MSPKPAGPRPVASNRKARHDYDILDTYEAGMVLAGSEVKSLREGKAQLRDSYARVQDGEVLMTDGPFAEGKEHIGGFWVIKAEDLDAALAWAARATEACASPVEVRPFQEETED